MRLIPSLARIGAAVFGVTAASCKEVQPPRSMSPPPGPSPQPAGISIRQAVAEEAHPLLTNMINDAFRHYHARYAKDLETAERVTSDGKQGDRWYCTLRSKVTLLVTTTRGPCIYAWRQCFTTSAGINTPPCVPGLWCLILLYDWIVQMMHD